MKPQMSFKQPRSDLELRKPLRSNQEEEEEKSSTLSFYKSARASSCSRFFIDENIREPSYYRTLIQELLTASSEDTIQLFIVSPGGYLARALLS